MTLRYVSPPSQGTQMVWTGDGFEEQGISGGPGHWVDAETGGAPTGQDAVQVKLMTEAPDVNNDDPESLNAFYAYLRANPDVAKFYSDQSARVAQQRGSEWDSKFANGAINAAAWTMMGMGAGAAFGGAAAGAGSDAGATAGASGSGGGAGGGYEYFDDYGNPMDFSPSNSGSGGGAGGGMDDPYGGSTAWPNDSPAGGPNGGETPGGGYDIFGLAKQYGPQALSLLKDTKGIWGPAVGAGLGALGASQQSSAFSDLAKKYMTLGEPSRQRYEASFQPGFSMSSDPGYRDALDQTTKATLHGLSVQGNPADSPNAWTQTLSDVNSKFAYPALQNYRNMNANAGGIASLQTAAPGASNNAINSQAGVYNALGAGAADIFNPPKSLAQLLKEARY